MSGRPRATVGELDVVDLFYGIPLAFIHMTIEANVASKLIFGYEAFPISIDFVACNELAFPVGIQVGGERVPAENPINHKIKTIKLTSVPVHHKHTPVANTKRQEGHIGALLTG
jgi:hypothetical protein